MRNIFLIYIVFVFVIVNSKEDYGWKTNIDDVVAYDGPCNIERYDADDLSQEDFLRRFACSEPVIIYNIKNEKFRRNTDKKVMLNRWSDTKIVLNSANTYSYTRVPSTFQDYVNNQLKPQRLDTLGNETLYLFGDIDPSTWAPLLETYSQPKWKLPGHTAALSFGIAGAATGVPWHFHGPGFAEVIHGSKRWFLYPYDERPEFDPDRATLEWYQKDYQLLPQDKKPLECLMRPGEIIYFPDKWWHATLNSETSVFISTFLSP